MLLQKQISENSHGWNGIRIAWKTADVADMIIRAAQGLVDEPTLAEWLRIQANESTA